MKDNIIKLQKQKDFQPTSSNFELWSNEQKLRLGFNQIINHVNLDSQSINLFSQTIHRSNLTSAFPRNNYQFNCYAMRFSYSLYFCSIFISVQKFNFQ
ncbi:unnamed protein product [Paramecium octaurelia]|uniref:Uncharacterized protein n=1 Tax=Paramecium octaurelia TaxID=43137 RepID=A0A8S1XS51_PAROT|nr:unnamed protein product [Paramecium octaurelia]